MTLIFVATALKVTTLVNTVISLVNTVTKPNNIVTKLNNTVTKLTSVQVNIIILFYIHLDSMHVLCLHSENSKSRKRTMRCGQCTGCKMEECGSCAYCKDMKKFGGPGKKKKACIRRKCLQGTHCIIILKFNLVLIPFQYSYYHLRLIN